MPLPSWMRTPLLALGVAVASLALLTVGCGGDEGTAVVETADVPALELAGDVVRGEQVWDEAGCRACHALGDAEATGTAGPDLDESASSFEVVATVVAKGAEGMPVYDKLLSDQEIADVSAYVAASAG